MLKFTTVKCQYNLFFNFGMGVTVPIICSRSINITSLQTPKARRFKIDNNFITDW